MKTFTAPMARMGRYVALSAILSVSAAFADPLRFDIPRQSLTEALKVFADQAKMQLLYKPDSISGGKSNAVIGDFDKRVALEMLLKGTGYEVVFSKGNAATIRPIQEGAKITSTATEQWLQLAGLESLSDGAQRAEDDASRGSTEGGSSTAGAAEKSAAAKKPGTVEEMIVEDTKIKPFSDANADLPRTINDPQPYYIFDSKEIERSGALTVQEFLRQRLTMDTTYETNSELFPSNLRGDDLGNALDGGGLAGTTVSSFNLRGLGANKTLILVNGRRMAGINYSRYLAAGANDYQPDLNGIPLSSIERIEVLPSSAGAIYGSNAIGGVINVVLKRSYEGGDLRLTYNAPSNSDAYTSAITGTYGLSFEGGKSQLMATAHYSTSEPMVVGERVQFMESGLQYMKRLYLNVATGDLSAASMATGIRASMGPTGTFLSWSGTNGLVLKDGTVVIPHPASGITLAYVAPGVTQATPMTQRWIPFDSNFLTPSPGYGPWGVKQPLGSVADIKSFSTSYTRQMNSWLDAFVDFQQNQNASKTKYAPGIVTNLGQTHSANPAPFLGNPFSNTTVNFGTTMTTPIDLQSTSLTRTMTAGVKGRFASGWSGELSYSRSENKFEHGYSPPPTNIIARDIWAGRLDMLVDPFAVDFDLSPYSTGRPMASRSTSDEIALRMAGPVLRLPWGSPTLSIGLQRLIPSIPGTTAEFWDFDYTPTTTNSPAMGYKPRKTIDATYLPRSTKNDAMYLEGNVPLVTDKNALPLIKALDVQVAQRLSRSVAQTGTVSSLVVYDAAGNISYTFYEPAPADAIGGRWGTPSRRAESYSSSNETFAFRYKPVESVTFRASIGTAFIPPTYDQLISDKKLTPNGTTISNDPVTRLPAYTADYVSGGNPDLKPQRSLSKDVGLIYEPTNNLLKGLRVNFQYYEIGQFDFISSPSIVELLTLPDFADRVTRDPVTQRVTQVDLSLTNVAERSSAGMDLAFDYQWLSAWGDWNFSLKGSRILYERRQARVTSPMIDYAGFPGLGGPAKHKASSNIVWGMQGVTLGLTTSWSGSYRLNGSPGDPVNGFQNFRTAPWALQGSYSVPAQVYHSVFVGYDFGKNARTKLLSGMALQLNVQNVFGTMPPFDVTRPPFYLSPLGSYRLREYALSLRKAF